MPRRSDLESRIGDALAILSHAIELRGSQNRNDLSVSVEKTLCGLLNRLKRPEGWALRDMNEVRMNYPGIDLADTKLRIAMQISAENSTEKVRRSLVRFFTHGQDKQFDTLIVLATKGNASQMQAFTVEVGGRKITVRRDDPESPVKLEIWSVKDLLKWTLALDDVNTLAEIAAYLHDELDFGTLSRKPRHLLPPVPRPSASFIKGSRDDELQAVEEMLAEDTPLFLWGVGGIGKTELAIQIAERFAPRRGAYFLRCCDMPDDWEGDILRETILRARFSGLRCQDPDTQDRDGEYDARMAILRDEYAGAMLIVDNFDRRGRTLTQLQAEQAYQDLTALDIRLVFTTRSQPMDRGCEVKPLSDPALLKLMRRNLDGGDVSNAELLALLEAVDRHTLMAVLIARTLAESWGSVTPAMMLAALRDSRLDQAGFPEVVNDQDLAEKKIYGHLQTLFRLTGLGKSDQDVLRCAALLPPGGMQDRLFMACLADSLHKPLRDLVKRGLLRREGGLLSIHPVIREVCLGELKPRDADCGPFLRKLAECVHARHNDTVRCEQAAGCFSAAAVHLEDADGEWAFSAAVNWKQIGQMHAALTYALRAVKRREERRGAGGFRHYKELSSAHNMVSIIYGCIYELERSLEYGHLALKARKKCFAAEDPRIASSMDNLGKIYSRLGRHEEALGYLSRALQMREKRLGEWAEDVARSCNNIGNAYYTMGSYEKALQYRMRGLRIRRKLHGENAEHVDVATSLNNVGRTYQQLGQYAEALEYELEALRIRKKLLRGDDYELANSYYNVGHTYSMMGRFPEAVGHMEQAIRIWDQCLHIENAYVIQARQELREFRALAGSGGVPAA